MPIEQPPTIPSSFLAAVAVRTWQADHLVDPLSGTVSHPRVANNAWELSASGLLVSQATYDSLGAGTANQDGSYTDATGVSWWLTMAAGWAVPVAK